jgi:hypothetical protein
MLDKHVVKVIIDTVIFLEYSNGKTIDPDASVEVMEQLALELQHASEAIQTELCKKFREMAQEYGDKAGFVAGLGESLGLIDMSSKD